MNLPLWPDELKLRKCQIQAYNAYIAANKRSFLADLTPGAGKTLLAARIAHAGLSDGRYHQVLVACPTELLKVQWMEKLAGVGIEITPYYDGGDVLESGYRGAALTYAQIASNASLFRHISTRYRTLVILDEPHHCGVNKSWGDATRHAFEHVAARLLITGTAWRSDGNPIPFVDYPGGTGRADYTYGYKDAIRDGVCRFVVFPTYEGTMEWISGQTGNIQQASFQAELNERETSERLKTALAPEGEWIADVLRDAHKKLLECRSLGHPSAGGLIVCIDEKHAQKVAGVVQRITGTVPMVVTSNTTDADREIEKFAGGTQEWVIAIKMVSEGVDIPRLRVGVYATNVTTPLFFYQFVGRFVRWTPNLPEQTAYVYIPEDPRIAANAYAIAQERNHVLSEPVAEEEEEDEWIDPRDGEILPVPSLFQPISAEAQHNGAIVDNDKIPVSELEQVRTIAEQFGQSPELMARIRRIFLQESGHSTPTTPQPEPMEKPRAKFRQAEKLKGRVNAQVSLYSRLTGREIKEIHLEWMKPPHRGKAHRENDVDDLKAKYAWISSLVEAEKNSRDQSTS